MRKILLLLVCGLMSTLGVDSRADESIAVVSGANSLIVGISREQAEALYSGRTGALRDGTPVRTFDLPPGPIRDAFYQRLIGKNPLQTRAHWSRMVFTGRARPPQQVSGSTALIDALSTDPHAIGYLSLAEVDERVRILLVLP